MLVISISGGLGNQMFQYAFGYAYARNHKEILRLDTFYIGLDKQRKLGIDKYNISCLQKGRFRGMLYYSVRKFCKTDDQLHLWNRMTHTIVEHSSMGFQNVNGKNLFAVGNWMNLNYFKSYRDDLLREYKYCGAIGDKQQRILDIIRNEESLAIHIRRGDYLNPENSAYKIIAKEYYVAALSYLKDRVDISNIYLFSDDIEWCKEEYKDILDITFIDSDISGDAHIDMELMKNCKYFIIANSTFGWWGAWLCEREGKIMIAPEKWFDENEHDICNKRLKDALLNDFIMI